jgi:hypothetical protein
MIGFRQELITVSPDAEPPLRQLVCDPRRRNCQPEDTSTLLQRGLATTLKWSSSMARICADHSFSAVTAQNVSAREGVKIGCHVRIRSPASENIDSISMLVHM